ncbi:MAG: Xaa-Pro peptidase family protein [Acidobacteriia bacterium]|nr:Xaa-Pro peptidase family protein [Terriglobia bacterium]
MSRRRFVQAGALATLGAGSLARSETEASCPPPSPSIAALASMKDQAVPITKEERAGRQEKARRRMRDQGMHALLLMEGSSLEYFTGIRWWGGERLFVVVFPVSGDPICICPAFEEGRAREQMAKSPVADRADVRTWKEDDNPYELLGRALKDHGLSAGAVGMEETIRYVFSSGIAKASPHLQVVSATPVTAGCRMIKSDHEVALMRLASKVTLAAYEATYRALKDGMTREQVSDLVDAAYDTLGFPGEVDVSTREYTSFPHGSRAPQIIREGTIILLDDGCKVEGYTSDITRTFVLGKATDKMKKVFDIVHRAQSEALKTARPGVECQAVDAAVRKVIVDAGYGPDYKFFTHRVGHGMGMDGHEWPYLVRGNSLKLAANMTFSDEPGIYIPGEFGIRLEDDMRITENGAELFTPQSPSLEEPFGRA